MCNILSCSTFGCTGIYIIICIINRQLISLKNKELTNLRCISVEVEKFQTLRLTYQRIFSLDDRTAVMSSPDLMKL